jgi:hypothetical protein
MMCTSVIPDPQEVEVEGPQSKAKPQARNTRPYPKNKLKQKGLGGVVQMQEAWNSNPSIAKTNKQKENSRQRTEEIQKD